MSPWEGWYRVLLLEDACLPHSSMEITTALDFHSVLLCKALCTRPCTEILPGDGHMKTLLLTEAHGFKTVKQKNPST